MLQRYRLSNDTKLAVVGDIHEHEYQFDELVKLIKPSEKMLLVSVGDIYDKGFGPEAAESITKKLQILVDNKVAYAVRGNHELKHIRKTRRDPSPGIQWWRKQPLVLNFCYDNGSMITVLHGGVTPLHTWNNLSDIEICYVRTIDEDGKMIKLQWVEKEGKKELIPEKPNGKVWHHLYDGRFGYIASGHDVQSDGTPKFYNYSCNLDSGCYMTGKLSCQIFSSQGREDLLTVEGPFKNGLLSPNQVQEM